MWSYLISSHAQAHYTHSNNATEAYNYLKNTLGYTDAAAIGVIANMEHESYINPGQQEIGYGGSVKRGYGLVQWTPADTKILAYADSVHGNWYDGALQMDYLAINAPASWIENEPVSYNEYKNLTDTHYATKVFFRNFERGTWHDVLYNYADYWEEYLTGHVTPPTPPTPPIPPPPAQDETEAMYLVGLILKWFE